MTKVQTERVKDKVDLLRNQIEDLRREYMMLYGLIDPSKHEEAKEIAGHIGHIYGNIDATLIEIEVPLYYDSIHT